MNVRRIVALITVTCLTVPILGCGNNTSTPTAPSSPSQGGSRNVRFEATGNYSGRLTAAFVLANGANTVEEIPSLPWTKDVSYPATARATAVAVDGSGGAAGQTIVLRVIVGGSQVSSTSGTALTGGGINVASPPYIF